MNYVTHSLNSAGISIFYWKSANFAISRNTEIDCILTHNNGYDLDDISKNGYSRSS